MVRTGRKLILDGFDRLDPVADRDGTSEGEEDIHRFCGSLGCAMDAQSEHTVLSEILPCLQVFFALGGAVTTGIHVVTHIKARMLPYASQAWGIVHAKQLAGKASSVVSQPRSKIIIVSCVFGSVGLPLYSASV